MSENLKFPVGKFVSPGGPNSAIQRAALIQSIAGLPAALRDAVAGLSVNQLETHYRPGGWTVRQVVHHVADSHMNAYIRFRLGLTEDDPAIKPYDEAAWAELSDARSGEVEVSLRLLETLHARWTSLMASLPDEAFARTFRHPEAGTMSLDTQLCLYEWHGRHHTAHIDHLRTREGW